MGGLLYKDFCLVRGKRLIAVLLILTGVFVLLRLVFPGYAANGTFMAVNDQGQEINLIDAFLILAPWSLLLFGITLINQWVSRIVDGDHKNKIRGYISTFPLEKNTYIASKYVFIGIAVYVLMSLNFIWIVAYRAFCAEGMYEDLIMIIESFVLPIFGLGLFMAAIELPLNLLLGTKRAKLIKTGIVMVIGLLALAFLFFGDITWLSGKLDVGKLAEWIKNHSFGVTLLEILSPVITLLLYGLSYRISCHFSRKMDSLQY